MTADVIRLAVTPVRTPPAVQSCPVSIPVSVGDPELETERDRLSGHMCERADGQRGYVDSVRREGLAIIASLWVGGKAVTTLAWRLTPVSGRCA